MYKNSCPGHPSWFIASAWLLKLIFCKYFLWLSIWSWALSQLGTSSNDIALGRLSYPIADDEYGMGIMENGAFDSRRIMPICLPEDKNFKVNTHDFVVFHYQKHKPQVGSKFISIIWFGVIFIPSTFKNSFKQNK